MKTAIRYPQYPQHPAQPAETARINTRANTRQIPADTRGLRGSIPARSPPLRVSSSTGNYFLTCGSRDSAGIAGIAGIPAAPRYNAPASYES